MAFAFAVYLAVLALAGRELFVRRAAVRASRAELVTYLALLVGLALTVHWVGYTTRAT